MCCRWLPRRASTSPHMTRPSGVTMRLAGRRYHAKTPSKSARRETNDLRGAAANVARSFRNRTGRMPLYLKVAHRGRPPTSRDKITAPAHHATHPTGRSGRRVFCSPRASTGTRSPRRRRQSRPEANRGLWTARALGSGSVWTTCCTRLDSASTSRASVIHHWTDNGERGSDGTSRGRPRCRQQLSPRAGD